QLAVLPFHRIRWRPPGRLRQGCQRRLVPLLTPRRDQRRVQPFPAQQRTLARLVQTVVLLQDPRLVRRGVGPASAPSPAPPGRVPGCSNSLGIAPRSPSQDKVSKEAPPRTVEVG